MSKEFTIVYFFEDIAHERFVRGLVRRAAGEKGLQIREVVGNATHGNRVWSEMSQYMRHLRSGRLGIPDVLIAVIDGNCHGCNEVKARIRAMVNRSLATIPYWTAAIPDPHIEAWYLGDTEALRYILPGSRPEPLQYKCEQDRYKTALKEAIRAEGVEPALGGAEYGADIARVLNPYPLGKRDKSFGLFWDDVNRIFQNLRASSKDS